MAKPKTLNQPITFDAQLCKDVCVGMGVEDFCFQLPMQEWGSELFQQIDNEIGLAADFTDGVAYNRAYDPAIAACGAPQTDAGVPINTAFPTAGQTILATGAYFWEVTLGGVTIDYGKDPDTGVSKQVQLAISPSALAPPPADYYAITDADANSTILFKGTESWTIGANMDIFIHATSECDGTNERIKWDITQDVFTAYPTFYSDTFTAEDDTFYRLKFNLDKTSGVTVKVTDSGGTTIVEVTESGPDIDLIFLTGTLPTTTVTIKVTFDDLTEYPNANFNVGILSSVTLYKYCPWTLTIEETGGTLIGTLTETHYSETPLSGYSDTYNPNIQYCYDITTLNERCYVFVATNDCDGTDAHTSNCFQVCTKCEETTISWAHTNVKFVGDQILDYRNYIGTTQFAVKTNLQDLTQEWDGVYYNDAAYYLQNPYSAYRNTQVLQVWPLPGFMRKALAVALTDIFLLDGVEYRKVDDDALTPGFNATDPAPVRVLVTQVGDFVQSKNV